MTSTAQREQERLPIERKVRVRRKKDDPLSMPEPISHYSDVHAWVLIGNPGAGKTDAFESRSEAEGGNYIKARDFIDLDLLLGPLIFIDGLDEIAAGNAMGFTALGQIRTKLQKLGTPRFRISCREADWRGNTDAEALQRLVGADNFLELHLEPLDSQQIEALVAHWQGSDAAVASAFVKEAEKHDLEGLLDNPQTLKMLVEATKSGWPQSKTQTYQMACARLVREHNDQWLANTRETAQPDHVLLEAAGYLYALMLLSGGGSLVLQKSSHSPSGVLALTELPLNTSAPDLSSCRDALHTRLFRGHGGGEFSPVHRTVAEYLAAQYLIKRINEGLPAGRVFALMLGEDRGVVPELRGLHAWLAVASTGNLRMELIDRDPLGVILNGDVRSFSRTEKQRVLDALGNEAKRYTYFRTHRWDSQSFGALATEDMEEDFRVLLKSADRSPAHLALVDCVLDAMAHGQPMPKLKAELEQVVRDASYWPGSRTEALRVLVSLERSEGNWSITGQLLEDINSNIVEDTEDELLGTLLQALYPRQIPVSKIWGYFRSPKARSLIGAYWHFWHFLAEEHTPAEDTAALLDALVVKGCSLDEQEDDLGVVQIVGGLIVKGIVQCGMRLDIAHLHRWLSLGLTEHFHCPLDPSDQEALKTWLQDHPQKYKEFFEYLLNSQPESQSPGLTIWQIEQQLYNAPQPSDMDRCYLLLAEKTSSEELRLQLVIEIFQFIKANKGADAALEFAEAWQVSHPDDAAWIDGFLQRPYPPDDSQQRQIDSRISRQNRLEQTERDRLVFFKKTLPSFTQENAHLGALVEVGNAYLNLYRSSKKATPEARLLDLLNQDGEWVELAIYSLRRCLLRKDLPTAKEVVELNAQGRRYSVAVPCLAAMEIRFKEDPHTALDLPDSTLEMMVAFRLTHDYDSPPDWFKQLLATRAEIFAHVMQPMVNIQIAEKKEHVVGLFALAHNADYSAVAKLITPGLLDNFPIKAHKKQLQSLRLLVVSLMVNVDAEVQLKIIATKLDGKPSDVAQHVYWLTAGLQLAPDLYLESARQYIVHTQARASHLIALVHEQRERNRPRPVLPIAAIKFLIELLGARCSPSWSVHSGWVSPAMELGRYVEGLVTTLAGLHEEEATRALTSLLAQKNLKSWEDTLRRAIFDQRVTRRKALFQSASVSQVCSTLANLTPANAADLQALTLDHLHQLGREIRDGNTNDYRQYWAGETPEVEDYCRDRLLSDLKIRLAPLHITAEPEGRYADEKRADIKVSAQGYQIPIEIKRDKHDDLWKAISNQLIPKYMRELASDGRGIFLVFWFGGTGQPVAGDGGTKPKSALELQNRLQKTVPEDYQDKISVLVIDCSLRPKD